MAIQIQIRRDTAANWTSANPVLAQGEMGYELDTNQAKFGNGTDNWNDLPYFGGSAVSVVFDDYEPATGDVSFALLNGKQRKYGFGTAITGDVTITGTGALEGVIPVMRHNSSTAPNFTVPGGVTLITSSYNYEEDEDNFIFFKSFKDNSGNLIAVSIANEFTS